MGRRSSLGAVLLTGGLLAATLAVPAAPAAANPTTPATYPAGSSGTWFKGLAFDRCEAPSASAMQAWRGAYGAVGVYISGRNRACKTQANLSSTWIGTVYAQGWKVIPIVVGYQAPCADRRYSQVIGPYRTNAVAQGEIDAAAAVGDAKGYGLRPGSAIYNDLENYSRTDLACRALVLSYLTGWTRELHRNGFVSGVYVNLSSGALDLSAAYTSTSYARPDAIWAARYDGNPSLALAGIPGTQWASRQRAKQYLADVTETHGGVTMTIDRNSFDAPVATVALTYSVTAPRGLNARTGPSTSYPVTKGYSSGAPLAVVCQTTGTTIDGSPVWDRLTDGSFVTDRYVSTPSNTTFSKPLPLCTYPFQVAASPLLRKRKSPSLTGAWAGVIYDGGLARVTCQRTGQSKVGNTSVWDRLDDGSWVSDHYVATRGSVSWTPPIPRC